MATRELVVQGKPSAEIVRVARDETVDMIVLGAHGKGMLDKALFGSTTERVVRRGPVPGAHLPAEGARVRRRQTDSVPARLR